MVGCGMGLDATARRRWFGALVLLAAVLMLVAGQTLLEGHLKGWAFVCYWLACLGCLGLAIIAALLDVLALRHRSRQEHRALLDATLRQIETEARSREKSSPATNNHK
jgi:drug/metabolite transporter (DMT)-like permease